MTNANAMSASIAEYYVQNMAVYPYLNVISHSYYDSDELYHHGIIGQKWGVRRYQNKDGSLTKAGKRRYQKKLSADIQSLDFLGATKDERLKQNIKNLINRRDQKRLEKCAKAIKDTEAEGIKATKTINHLASKLDANEVMKAHQAKKPEFWEGLTQRERSKLEEYFRIDGRGDTIRELYPELAAKESAYDKAVDKGFRTAMSVGKRVGGRIGRDYAHEWGNISVNDEIGYAIQNIYGIKKISHSSDGDSDELYHHGIPGQKWYVRRFQDIHGKLTAAGKKRKQRRQLKEARKAKAAKAKANAKAAAKKEQDAVNAKRKADSLNGKYLKAKTMTDEELNRAIARMGLETRYREALKNYTYSPEEAQRLENRARRKEQFKDKLYDKGTTIATNMAGELVANLLATSVNAATGNQTINKNDLLKVVNSVNNGGGKKKKNKAQHSAIDDYIHPALNVEAAESFVMTMTGRM